MSEDDNENIVNLPNPSPIYTLTLDFCKVAVVVFCLLLFTIVGALLERIRREEAKKKIRYVRMESLVGDDLKDSIQSCANSDDDDFEGGPMDDHEDFWKWFFGHRTDVNSTSLICCCKGFKLGAIRFVLRPYFLIMEWIAMVFMIEIYYRDWKDPKDYIYYEWCNPRSYVLTSIAMIVWFQVSSTILTVFLDLRNFSSRSVSVFMQVFALRSIYQMYQEVVHNQDSQEMMEVALLQSLLFSFPALLNVMIYGFEAFAEAGNQSSWYMMMYIQIFLSSVNIARGINYRDKYGLKRDSVFWNFWLIVYRISEVLLRASVLAMVAAFLNKTLLSMFVGSAVSFFIFLRMQREKFFRCKQRHDGTEVAKSSNMLRKFVEIVMQTVNNYLFFEWHHVGFGKGMNYYKILETIVMISLLIVKNEHEFGVFQKEHQDFPVRVFVYLRIVPCTFLMVLSVLLLWCSNNYSPEQYAACTQGKIRELIRRQRFREIRSLIERFDVETLSPEQANIIYDRCNISIHSLLESNFSIGQICRLRYPIQDITKQIEWKRMKDTVKKMMIAKITKVKDAGPEEVIDQSCNPKEQSKNESTKPSESTTPSQDQTDATTPSQDKNQSPKPSENTRPSKGSVEMMNINHGEKPKIVVVPVENPVPKERSDLDIQPEELKENDPNPKHYQEPLKTEDGPREDSKDPEILETMLKSGKKELQTHCDHAGDAYFYWGGSSAPFFRIVNFILRTEGKEEADRFDSSSTNKDMSDALIENKLNVFLWRMCHKKQQNDVKEYQAFNLDSTDDFKLFDLECIQTLFRKQQNDPDQIFDNCDKDDRKTGFEDIHVFVKYGTKKPKTAFKDDDGLYRLDHSAGFFLYKDIRKEKKRRHHFLQTTPTNLFELYNGEGIKSFIKDDKMPKKQTPSYTLKSTDEMVVDELKGILISASFEKELVRKVGKEQKGWRWRIVKINNDDVDEDTFEDQWKIFKRDNAAEDNAANDNKYEGLKLTFQYEQPAYIDLTRFDKCQRCYNCFKGWRTYLENSQSGVNQLQPHDKVRFKKDPTVLKSLGEKWQNYDVGSLVGELLRVEDHPDLRQNVLRNAGMTSVQELESVQVWDVRILDDKGQEADNVSIPAVSLVKLSEDKYCKTLKKADWENLEIDQYNWKISYRALDDDGMEVAAPKTLEEIKEGFTIEWIQKKKGEKWYVDDFQFQHQVVELMTSKEKDEDIQVKFVPDEAETFSVSCFCAYLTYSVCCCIPCAWLSYRPYCGRGGQKYSAEELIENRDKFGKYLIDDGDIFLASYAMPGWLSLAQGGAWGHCGLIYRYKEKSVQFLPQRFQTQLERWKERGIVEEGTPLVFEMANHGREADTNEFQVHLSHLQNWHMFHDARKYFGPSIGFRKFKGERDIHFYKHFFKIMHRHHMKPYESVPMEFICSGLCFFPTTPYEIQIQELFCSELVADFHYHLEYKDKKQLLPSYVLPSEFQPSDYGEHKSACPFCFVCCCCLGYHLSCMESRQAWRYEHLRDLMGPLYILDISSIDEWEDKVKSKRDNQQKVLKNLVNENNAVGIPGFSRAMSRSFMDIGDNEEMGVHEAVRRKRLQKMGEKHVGQFGFLLVELTWWFFYITTFPAGIFIRIRYHLTAVDSTSASSRSRGGNKKKQGVEDGGNFFWNFSVLIVGCVYLFLWFLIFRLVIFGFDSMSLWEILLYVYFLGIIFLGCEGVCCCKRHCYDSIFRWSFRLFGVKLKKPCTDEDDHISDQLGPVKIPFITVFTLSLSIIVGLILDALGYKRDGVEFKYEEPEKPLLLFGSVAGLMIVLYKLCQHVIQNAIGMSPEILLQLDVRSPYRQQEFENTIVEFLTEEDAHNQEQENVVHGAHTKLTLDKAEVEKNIVEIKKRLAQLEKCNIREDVIDIEAVEPKDTILNILVLREMKNLEQELKEANTKLESFRVAIDKRARRDRLMKEFPPWFKELNGKEKQEFEDAFLEAKNQGETTWINHGEALKTKHSLTRPQMNHVWKAFVEKQLPEWFKILDGKQKQEFKDALCEAKKKGEATWINTGELKKKYDVNDSQLNRLWEALSFMDKHAQSPVNDLVDDGGKQSVAAPEKKDNNAVE